MLSWLEVCLNIESLFLSKILYQFPSPSLEMPPFSCLNPFSSLPCIITEQCSLASWHLSLFLVLILGMILALHSCMNTLYFY